MAKEDERLLGGRYIRRQDTFWPVKFRTCLWCFVCLLVVGVSALVVYDIIKLLKRNSEDKKTVIKVDSSKLGVPNNLSDLQAANAHLCKKVSDKNETATQTANGVSNIYIIKSEKNLTNEQACGIESILRLFPDKTVYLIDFNRHENKHYVKCSSNQNYLGLLLYLYKDRLQLLPANRGDYFKHTPLQNHPMADEDFIFLAMVLTAYKYSGFVASSNVIMTSRDLLDSLPEETIVNPVVIVTSKKCDDFLHYLMQSFNMCRRDNSSVDDFLNRAVKLYTESVAGKSVRTLSPGEVCANTKRPCMFITLEPRCSEDPSLWLGDLAGYCKQVVQAFLGIKVNQMEVEEETSRMRSKLGWKCEGTAEGQGDGQYHPG